MFVYSVKSSKIKLFILIALVALSVVALIFLSSGSQATANPASINLKASNEQERLAFLAQFNWEVKEEPIEVSELIIPTEFDEVYEKYNKLQMDQGFNLAKYQGKRVKRWIYEVRNYEGYEPDSGCIHANILIFDGLVIGGDICSIELDGFMHGFARQ